MVKELSLKLACFFRMLKLARKDLPVIFFFLSFFLALSSISYASTKTLDFNDQGDFSGWSTNSAYGAGVAGGRLILPGGYEPKLLSPSGLAVPREATLFRIRARAKKGCAASIFFATDKGAQFFSERFFLDGGPDFKDYKIRIEMGGDPGVFVDRLGLSFYTAENEIEIDLIEFVKPSFYDNAAFAFKDFWTIDPVTFKTIFAITELPVGPLSFVTALYILMAVVFILAFLVYRRRGRGAKREAVLSAVLVAFIVSGSIYTLRMDYKWLNIWRDDSERMRGKSIDERMTAFVGFYYKDFDHFFDFINFVKGVVPEGSTIRPAARQVKYNHDFIPSLARYYLLPLKISTDADYLWVYDKEVSYDPVSGDLTEGGRVIAGPVTLVAASKEKGEVYRLLREGGK